MDVLMMDWLGTPAWFWLAFGAIVLLLTAFDLGFLHCDDREMGVGESLKLSASGSGPRRARWRPLPSRG